MTKLPSTLEMIKALIATPSISSVLPELDMGNRDVIDQLANWLQDEGFRVDILPLQGQPDKANLMAVKGPKAENAAGGLVLSGHTDTVPCNPERWTHDPFQVTEIDNKLYGLGTTDMKSFLAMAITAARSFAEEDLKEPLIILATADEESSMQGAKALVDTLSDSYRSKARAALVGEPTGLKPIRMHKGIMMESIRVIGRSGHSSDPSLGLNALEGMHQLIEELLILREELQARYQNPMFAVPVPTMNLGHIHGGDNPNRICGECVLDLDIRLLPGMDIEEMRALLQSRLSKRLAGTAFNIEHSSLFSGIPAMETAAHTELIRTCEQLSGYSAEAVAFATEGPYLQKLGMNVVIMGPGNIDVAHQPDEYLETNTINPTVQLLEQLITKHCVGQ